MYLQTNLHHPTPPRSWPTSPSRILPAVRRKFSPTPPSRPSAKVYIRPSSLPVLPLLFLFFFTRQCEFTLYPQHGLPHTHTHTHTLLQPITNQIPFSPKQTSENHFYSIRPTLYSLKETQSPPWLMNENPRRPRVKIFSSNGVPQSLRRFWFPLLSPCPQGWRSACLRATGCIESGDDLDPVVYGLAFGRVAGVGDGGSLTGFIPLIFFSLSSCACHVR